MDSPLTHVPLNLGSHRVAHAQRSGPLTVVPLLGGADHGGDEFVPPLTGLKLSRVAGYGKVEMECLQGRSDRGVAIVPLHIGYIQDGAQNHALCRSGLLAAGQKRMFEDACCVQAAQGGYLEGREQWFFILPLALRGAALALRGEVNYGKLWGDIGVLNGRLGKSTRGHLDEVIVRERPWLTQYNGRFERVPDQIGALFFVGDKLAGIELAPNPVYFAEVWPALVSFCYGVEAMRRERANGAAALPPFTSTDLPALRAEIAARRAAVDAEVAGWLAAVPSKRLHKKEEERLLDLKLFTTSNEQFAGQIVERDGTTVYASIAAQPAWLYA